MNLRDQLKRDEGLSLRAYRDSLGHWTIGYGHLLDKPVPPITLARAEALLDADIRKAEHEVLQALPWAADLDDARRGVLINMAFQLGLLGLLRFARTLRHVRAREYDQAAEEMLDSRWREQTPARAERMSRQMLTGKWA